MVVVACRNPTLGEGAVNQLRSEGGEATFLPIDLADQASIRRFVDLLRDAGLPLLAAIICNAGTQNVGTPHATAQGYETTFAVNHLGHYLLVRLLLDDLEQDGRVTFVSSGTHDPSEKTGMPEPVYQNADMVAHDLTPGRQAGLRRYTTSKLCNVLCTFELARRLAASNDPRLSSIRVNAIDPGFMPATGLARSWSRPLRWVSRNILPLLRLVNDNVHSPRTSAERVAALTVGPDAAPGGRYFSNGNPKRASELAYDRGRQLNLWITSAAMTKTPVDVSA